MGIARRPVLLGLPISLALPASARAQSAASLPVRIGVLTDMSGLFRDVTGPTSVACSQQAVAEFLTTNPGLPVEVLVGDHQNKPDVSVALIRSWFDRDSVDVVVGAENSAVALACADICAQHDKVHLNTGAGTSELTGKSCNANTIHWTLDTWNLPHSTADALTKNGGDTWFFISANYTFGRVLQHDATQFVEAAGGKVVGSAQFAFPETTDFSSFLLQAQASGAKVLGIAASGESLVNLVKQAREFGIDKTVTLAALACLIDDVRAIGLPTAQGLVLTENFYWDFDARTRAFTERVRPRLAPGIVPNMDQAGNYSAVVHYLKALKSIGAAAAKNSGRAVVAEMKRLRTDDDCFGQGSIREDGRKVHPAYLFRVKKPEESHYANDFYDLVSTTPAEQAFRPMQEGGCPLVRT